MPYTRHAPFPGMPSVLVCPVSWSAQCLGLPSALVCGSGVGGSGQCGSGQCGSGRRRSWATGTAHTAVPLCKGVQAVRQPVQIALRPAPAMAGHERVSGPHLPAGRFVVADPDTQDQRSVIPHGVGPYRRKVYGASIRGHHIINMPAAGFSKTACIPIGRIMGTGFEVGHGWLVCPAGPVRRWRPALRGGSR